MPTRRPDPNPHPAPRPGTTTPVEVEPLQVTPEVQVHGDEVQVTLAHPEIAPDALGSFVGSNLLLVWSTADPDAQRLLVHLPCDVRPETAIIRFTNGVLDVTVRTARTADDSSSRSSSDGSQ